MIGRRSITLDGVQYAPGALFIVVAPGARLNGSVPVRGGSNGWSQPLNVGDVITCTGFGSGAGADPGDGVEFTSEQSKAAGAFHVDFYPQAGSIWTYRPAPGFLAPAVTISLIIENSYELYADETTYVTDKVIPAPPAEGTDAYDEWADEFILSETGVGHEDGDSWYDVVVTASSDPALVGRKFDFGY